MVLLSVFFFTLDILIICQNQWIPHKLYPQDLLGKQLLRQTLGRKNYSFGGFIDSLYICRYFSRSKLTLNINQNLINHLYCLQIRLHLCTLTKKITHKVSKSICTIYILTQPSFQTAIVKFRNISSHSSPLCCDVYYLHS